MVSKLRTTRIGNRIQEEIAELLHRELSDERLIGVVVTDVAVDRELSFAVVFVSAIEGIQRAPDVLAALNHARGFIRRELSQRIQLRSFPHLRFRWDATAEKAEHMEQLFATLHTEEQDAAKLHNEESTPGE